MAWAGCRRRADRYFEVTRRGSDFQTEVRGGCVTFLTMSYILLVNPQILCAWAKGSAVHGDYISDSATATALTCGLGSILTGILSGLPFAVGPGMGLNTLFAGLCVAACSADNLCHLERAVDALDMAATTTFLMGFVLFILTAFGWTHFVLLILPATLKTALMVGIGAFQAFVGIRWMEIIVPGPPSELLQLESIGKDGELNFDWTLRGNPTSGYAQLLFVFCLISMSALFRENVKGSILIAIALATAISWIFEIGGGEAVFPFDIPTLARSAFRVDPSRWLSAELTRPGSYFKDMVVMFLITVFDVGGIQWGIGKSINLPEAKRRALLNANVEAARAQREVDVMFERRPTDDDLLPGRSGQMVYLCVGLSTMLSGLLGCSPCIVFLECAAGVREGAKTGLASVVTGLLFLASMFVTPVFQHVPICASAAPLVFVGCLMMHDVGEINWNDLNHALPAFLCILMMPFSGSVTWGIIFGLISYGLMALSSPKELLERWRGGEFVDKVSPPPSPQLRLTPSPHEQYGYVSISEDGRAGTPGLPGRGSVTSLDSGEAGGVSVARIARQPSGSFSIVEEMVPIERNLATTDDIHRVRMSPQLGPRAPPSVVSKALIGSPH